MAKVENHGAFTIRPSKDAGLRKRLFILVDLMENEISRNKKMGDGPRSKSAIVLEALASRYASELERKERDAARIRRDTEQYRESKGLPSELL